MFSQKKKYSIHKKILALSFLFLSFHAYAQQKESSADNLMLQLSGTIIDKEDDSAVPYVLIINRNTGQGTSSDLSGNFAIDIHP